MWGSIIGAGIGAAGSLLGGLLGKSGAEDALDLQKDAMQRGIRWRVNDAKMAGIHPLYALGAPTFNPSPINVQEPMANALSQMGQDIGGAVAKNWDPITKAAAALDLESREIDNAIKRRQLELLNQTPGVPGVAPLGNSGVGGAGVGGGAPAYPDFLVGDGGVVKVDKTNTPHDVRERVEGDMSIVDDFFNWMAARGFPVFGEQGIFPNDVGMNDLAKSSADWVKQEFHEFLKRRGLSPFPDQVVKKNNQGMDYWDLR